MAFFDRLFGRRPAPAEPDAAQPAFAPTARTVPDLQADASSLPAPVKPDDIEPSAVAGILLSQPQEAPSLRTLYGYQKDPAFNNFQERLKHPPGLQPRTRMPNLDYPPPTSSPGSRPPSRPTSSTPPTKPER